MNIKGLVGHKGANNKILTLMGERISGFENFWGVRRLPYKPDAIIHILDFPTLEFGTEILTFGEKFVLDSYWDFTMPTLLLDTLKVVQRQLAIRKSIGWCQEWDLKPQNFGYTGALNSSIINTQYYVYRPITVFNFLFIETWINKKIAIV